MADGADASGVRPRRVRGSGNGARWFVIPWGCLLVGLATDFILGSLLGRHAEPALQLLAALAFPAVLIPLIVRSLMMGVWFDGDTIKVTTWFRVRRFPAGTGVRCRAVNYQGLLSYGVSGLFYMLRFDRPDAPSLSVPGMIALRRSAVGQAATIQELLGRVESAGASATTPAHLEERQAHQSPRRARAWRWRSATCLVVLAIGLVVATKVSAFPGSSIVWLSLAGLLILAGVVLAVLAARADRPDR